MGIQRVYKSFFGRNIFFFFVHFVVGIVVKISAYNLTGIHDETFTIFLKNDVIDREERGVRAHSPFLCSCNNVESGMIIVASSYLTKKPLSVSGTSFFSKI